MLDTSMTPKTTRSPLASAPRTGYASRNGNKGRVEMPSNVSPVPSPHRPGGGRPLRGDELLPGAASFSSAEAEIIRRAIAQLRGEMIVLLNGLGGRDRLRAMTMMEHLSTAVIREVLGAVRPVLARAHARIGGAKAFPKNLSSSSSSPSEKSLSKKDSWGGSMTAAIPSPFPVGVTERETLRWLVVEGYRRLGKTVAFSTQTPHLKKHLADCSAAARRCLKDGHSMDDLLRVVDLAAEELREKGNRREVKWMRNLALLWRPGSVRNTMAIEDYPTPTPPPTLRKASNVILRTGEDRARWMAGLQAKWAAGRVAAEKK